MRHLRIFAKAPTIDERVIRKAAMAQKDTCILTFLYQLVNKTQVLIFMVQKFLLRIF